MWDFDYALPRPRRQSLLIGARRPHMGRTMTQPSGLDDRHQAQFAWMRFRKIMWGMAAIALISGLLIAALIWWLRGPLPWFFIGMVVVGVWATVMMAALLMGLMFLSSGTGHDAQVEDRTSRDVLGDED